jgi:hypothetical protein
LATPGSGGAVGAGVPAGRKIDRDCNYSTETGHRFVEDPGFVRVFDHVLPFADAIDMVKG